MELKNVLQQLSLRLADRQEMNTNDIKIIQLT